MTPSTPPVPVQPLVPPIPYSAEASQGAATPPVLTPTPKKVSGVLIAGLILLFVSVLALVGYYFIQTKGLNVNISTPTPIATVEPTVIKTPLPTPDQTNVSTTSAIPTDWKTYPPSNTGTPFSFSYPPEVVQSDAQDLSYFKSGNSTLYLRFIGKTQDMNSLINNYQFLGSPKITFPTKTAITFGKLNGYKAISANDPNIGSSTHYFLGNSSLNGILDFSFDTGDTTAESLFNQIVGTISIK
jgi:hypothetical protein